MMSSATKHLPLLVSGACLFSSCVYDSNPVPEMPYTPRRQAVVQPVLQPAVQQPVVAPGAWNPTLQPTVQPQPTTYAPGVSPALPPAVNVRPVATPQVVPAVAPAVAPATSTHVTQPFTPPVLTPAPAAMQPPTVTNVTPPTPSTAGQASTPTDPKLITNTGPIPVAMRVEGDPIRVYNPLDTTKTIRIIDPKTGKVYPSGKVLKVKGTNFKFIVP